MLALFLSTGLSWWEAGHRIVATIAQRELEPSQVQWLNSLFSLWPGEEGNLITLSTWQDDIKGTGSYIAAMASWHYVNTPYIPPGQGQVTRPPPAFNVTSVLRDTITLLSDKTTTSPWALSFALRNLVHFVADAHNPMHAVALFDSNYPTGDSGGNLFNMDTSVFGTNGDNLHKYWDSGGFSYQTPWPESDFEANLTRILEAHPRSKLPQVASLDPGRWSQEAYAVASNSAYTAQKGTTASEEYLVKCRTQSEELLVLAGYRLADLLKKFFKDRGLLKLELPNSVSEKAAIGGGGIAAWVFVSNFVVIIIVGHVRLRRSE
jgi:hypothetical protein